MLSFGQLVNNLNLLLKLGMLSKGKGQVLRVAAALHVLTGDHKEEGGDIIVSEVPNVISEKAIKAARNYVETCCQHAAYIAGRTTIDDEMDFHAGSAGTYI